MAPGVAIPAERLTPAKADSLAGYGPVSVEADSRDVAQASLMAHAMRA